MSLEYVLTVDVLLPVCVVLDATSIKSDIMPHSCSDCKYKVERYANTLDMKPYCTYHKKFIPKGNCYYNFFCNGVNYDKKE